MTMSKLAELLRRLGSEADLHDEYLADPKGVMERHGLSDEEVQAMLAKDVERLKELSGIDTLKSNGTINAPEVD
jgi:hypothetical protein